MVQAIQPINFMPTSAALAKNPRLVMVGGKTFGMIAWEFANGDIIARTESSFWYVPKGLYTRPDQ